jgi:hypothetical protein
LGATEPAGHGVAAEPDRVSTRTVLRFGLVLAVLSIVAMLLMAAFFKLLERGAERRDAATVDAAGLERRRDRLPPPPRLEVYGSRHWRTFRSAEEMRLSTYGWMDRSTGAVHIPIERAIDLIAERGVGPLPPAPMALPSPAATPAPGGTR